MPPRILGHKSPIKGVTMPPKMKGHTSLNKLFELDGGKGTHTFE